MPDTACGKTLVGEYTFAEEHEFRFGNAGLIRARWIVKIPFGRTAVMVYAAVLPLRGARTPLLLSKGVLKWLGCVLDLERDVVIFKKLKEEIKMKETDKSHYAIPVLGELEQNHVKKPRAARACLWCDQRRRHGEAGSTGKAADGEPGHEPRAVQRPGDLRHKVLDGYDDEEDDEPRVPISGMNVLDLGKFRSQTPTSPRRTKGTWHGPGPTSTSRARRQ